MLDIDRRLEEQRQQLRQNLDALVEAVKAGRETVQRNHEADKRAHEQDLARKDKRKEKE